MCGVGRSGVCGDNVSSLKTASAETLLYNPIVTVVGDGTATGTAGGATVSVDLFNNSVAGQARP